MKGIFPRIYESEHPQPYSLSPDTDTCFGLTVDEGRRLLGEKARSIDDIFDAIGTKDAFALSITQILRKVTKTF